ncbi:MAG: TonB-dependent receptor [Hyphomonadaceae bacterium]
MNTKKFLSGVALTALALSLPSIAHAQSTASQLEDEEIVVTGRTRSIEGAMTAEQAARARSTLTEEFIETQAPGQTILQTINLLPGVNFTNNDAYGASGGSVNLRGFDGNRVSLTFDGIQMNDSGNYAIFSSQLLDPELITRANVNLGTSEVDSPTASAVGGTINFVTRTPPEDMGGAVSVSGGTDNFMRVFGEFDTGEFWGGTTAYATASYQQNDLFEGPGEMQRTQYNARLYHPLEGDDFVSVAFFYNQGRNNFFRRFSMAQFNAGTEPVNITNCARDLPTAGVADNDGAGNSNVNTDPASCTNYYNLRFNPVDVANIRAQSRFSLTDSVTLTVDPSFQYTMANGGGTTVVAENDQRLRGASGAAGVDLNGDGDVLDQVRLYSPSNTNTRRWGLFTGLIWDLNESHRIRVNYTFDQANHRQTGEYGFLNPGGDPSSIWGGKDGWGADPILTADGGVFQKRDRFSIAELQQWSAEYRGDFFGDLMTLTLGVRAPEFTRELNNNCYATVGSTNDPICTSGPAPAGTIAPFDNVEVAYDDVLPNVGLAFRPLENHMFFISYAESLSAPRTDDLYNGLTPAQMRVVSPESSEAYDIGYRYQGSNLLVSATLWANQYHDRIERVTIDPGPPEIRAAANVGDVELWGADLEGGWRVTDALTLYGSASYVESEIQDDLVFNNNGTITFALTGGKALPDRPEWTFAARGEYEVGGFTIGLQGKFTDERWADLVNSQAVDAYTTFDLDLRWDLGEAWNNERTYLQLNVINLTDERYIGFISTQVNNPGSIYQLGAPRTVALTLRTEF